MNATGSREPANGRDPAEALKPSLAHVDMRCPAVGSDAQAGSRDVRRLGVSTRGACGALRFDTSSFHDKSRRTHCPAGDCEAMLPKGSIVHDQLAMGKTPRILTIVDTHSRSCPAVDPRFSSRARTSSGPSNASAKRAATRYDQGGQPQRVHLPRPGAYANDVVLDVSRPGKPADNGFIEAFNSRLRSECLTAHWFMSLADSHKKLEDRRRPYDLIP